MRALAGMHVPPRWVVVVSLAVAATILGDSLLYAVLPTVYDSLGLKVGLVGVLLSANRFVRLVSNPIAGWVMGRVGVRGPFVAAVFAAVLTTAAYASGLGFTVLLIARAAWGVCWSFLRLGGYLAALEAAKEGNRGYYLGFFNGVVRFGSFIAVLTGGLLTDLIGFKATVLLFTGVSFVGGLVVLGERPPGGETVRRDRPRPVRPVADPAPASRRPASVPAWPMRAVCLTCFLQGFAISGLVTATLGLWLLRSYGERPSMLGLAIGVATVSGALLSTRFLGDFLWGPIAGHIADRRGQVRVTLVAGAVEIVALVALAFPRGLVWTIVAAVAVFLASTALQVSLDATAGSLGPVERRSRTMSWYTTWHDLGSASGPLVGYLVGAGLGLNWMYGLAAMFLLLAGTVHARVFREDVLRGPQARQHEAAPVSGR